MPKINTLVYLDLEATGLKSSGRPRITEISLVAVNTQDILSVQVQLLSYLQKQRNQNNLMQAETIIPRVLNKLTLSVYPMATIMPEVTRITGLDNYNLTGQARFDNHIGDLLNAFLARLPSPVCLVAHNGQMYDFPLLKAEMQQASRKLESRILYIDSLIGIKKIVSERKKCTRKEIAGRKRMQWIENRKIVQKEKLAATELMYAGEFDSDMEAISTNNQEADNSNLLSKHANEMTPPKSDSKVVETHAPKRVKKYLVKQELKQKVLLSNASAPKSFSLINLHSHFLGFVPTQSHGAEADCLSLIRTTAMLGQDWIDWVEKNCQSIQNCIEMWDKIDKLTEDSKED